MMKNEARNVMKSVLVSNFHPIGCEHPSKSVCDSDHFLRFYKILSMQFLFSTNDACKSFKQILTNHGLADTRCTWIRCVVLILQDGRRANVHHAIWTRSPGHADYRITLDFNKLKSSNVWTKNLCKFVTKRHNWSQRQRGNR